MSSSAKGRPRSPKREDTLDSRDDPRTNAPPSFTTDNTTEKCINRFLTLPTEIRLRIYDELLISRFDLTQNPAWAIGDTNQKLILLYMIQSPQYRTMEPSVLQTCKQIHQEANSILYSKNVFAISEPEHIFRLVSQIGVANFSLIKRLDIWVPQMAKPPEWVQLLHLLAEKANGLRYVEIALDTDNLGWTSQRGLGDNQDFVRALGAIQGLDELAISGYYAADWPAYLGKTMGVRVEALRGHYCKQRKPKAGDLNNEELEDERGLRNFKKYQQGMVAWTS